MTPEDLKRRTKAFGLRIIKLIEKLPSSKTLYTISSQLVRCSTSIGANYRAVCRAKSTADFINKLSIVEEEADESCYWLELLIESGVIKSEQRMEEIQLLHKEVNEITAIIVSSKLKVKSKIINNK